MQTIYEERETEDGLIEAFHSMLVLDLDDNYLQWPDEVLAAFNTSDEDIIEDNDIPPYVDVAGDNFTMPNPHSALDWPGFEEANSQASQDRRTAYVKAAKEHILKSFRYEVAVDIQDLHIETEIFSDNKAFVSRQKANEMVLALFQGYIASTIILKDDWVDHEGYAEANEFCFNVDEDGCISLGASCSNDEWNLLVKAMKTQ